MNLRDMSVRLKLSLTFGGLAALVLLVAGLSLLALNAANQRFMDYVDGLNARATAEEHVQSAVDPSQPATWSWPASPRMSRWKIPMSSRRMQKSSPAWPSSSS